MKILTALKRMVDYNVKVRVKADGSGVDLANVKMSMNPFCEIAVEEAVRLKERGITTEIVAVSVGPAQAQEQLRTALALGADRAILIETDEELGSLAVAKLLRAVVDREQPQVVITGKQAIDSDKRPWPARARRAPRASSARRWPSPTVRTSGRTRSPLTERVSCKWGRHSCRITPRCSQSALRNILHR